MQKGPVTNTLLCPAIIRTYLVPSFPYRRFRATVAVQATALPEASLFLGLQLTVWAVVGSFS